MSDSESNHASSTSEDVRESEPSISKGKQRVKKRKEMSSSSSEGEEEEEEEEPQQQATSSCVSTSELSKEEEGAVGPILDEVQDNLVLSEGDDDGDSVDTDSSSDVPGAETCAICLGRMRGEVGSPESCEHTFCLICILEWAKTNASCPQDRKAFTKVLVRMTLNTEEMDREVVIKKQETELVLIPETDNPTYCEVCHECDREERLLLCDGCDLGYHLECLDPPLDQVPLEEWFCPICESAQLSSTVMGQQTREGESSTSRSRTRRLPSSSQRPRLIPRTRATERVRDRIIRKRKEKRKKRKRNRKRKIESGEIDDPRAPVDSRERLKFFGSMKDEVPAEDANDTFADHLLAGVSEWPSSRNPIVRKIDAVKILQDSAFTPSTSYAGKASVAVINRINIQSEETREDDVLSSILQKQSIVLTNSKKLSLTSDRKFKKEGEVSDAESFSLKQEESSLMSEPLPSRRPTQKDEERKGGTSEEDDQRHSSPPRGTPHSHFSRHSSFSHNSRYGHGSQRFEFNHRAQRGEREFRDERIQREERLSGSVHQSPLEDKRRSPPRMSYQRQMPSQQFRNHRNTPFDNRNRDPHRWDDRQRCQRGPPWKDSGYRQKQSSNTHGGHRHTESSDSRSREASSQDRYGRNSRDNSKENSNHKSYRSSSDKRGCSPSSSVQDKYSRRSQDRDKYSRREEDRRRKEDRGYHRQHHQRDHSHHRGYKSFSRTDRESPSSHSRSPVRSKSPIRSRSPDRSRSRSRLRETRSRDRDEAKRRVAHKHSSDNGKSASRASISPVPSEGSLDECQQEGVERVTPGNDSECDAKPLPHCSQVHESTGEPSSDIPHSTPEKDKVMEANSRTIKNELPEDQSAFPKKSFKAPRELESNWKDIKDNDDTSCDHDVVDEKPVLEELNLRKPEIRIVKEEKGSVVNVKTEDNLLNDAKNINFSVQSSCKGDQKRDKLHEDIDYTDSRNNGKESDTESLQSVFCAKDTIKGEQQSEDETTLEAESQSERKKRRKYLSGFFGRVLEYTPEVELSQWDENSSADVSSPFMVIRKSDTHESERGISLPFSLQSLLPGEKNIAGESDDKKKTLKERKLKRKSDSESRHEEKKHLERQKNEGLVTVKLERTDTDNIKKEEEIKSQDKPHKKKSGHKAPKADTKPPNNKPQDSVSPSSSHATIPRSKSKERFTNKTTMEDSPPQASMGKERLAHSSIKQEVTQSTSQSCNLPTVKSHEHSHKKEPAEKLKGLQGIFGDISDLSGTDSDEDVRSKKLIKKSPDVGISPEKQKDTHEIKYKPVHDKAKDQSRKSEHERNILKSEELPTKTLKLEATVATSVMSCSQKEDTKSKNRGRGTKNAKPNKGHVLDLFGNSSDSDAAENVEVKVEETRLQKSPEKLLRPSPFKNESVHRKGREATDIHKGKDRRSDKETSPHTKSLDKTSKSSTETQKHDSVHKKGKETTNSHKRKDRKTEKETSPHRKSSEEVTKDDSVSKKEKDVPDTHKRKEKKSERETSPHKKSLEEPSKSSPESCKEDSMQGKEEPDDKGKVIKSEKETWKSPEEPSKMYSESPRSDSVSRKEKEDTDSHKEKDIKPEKETSIYKKSPEKPSKSFSELLESGSTQRKAREATDTHKRKDKKSERNTSPHKKSSDESSKSSSDSYKHDTVQKKEKEDTDNHKEKDIKLEKETSTHKKSPEKPSKSFFESLESGSTHRKAREATDTHKRKDRKSEKKTSPHRKSEESSKIDLDLGKIKEAANSHEEQKDTYLQEKTKKVLEKPLKAEQLKSESDIEKGREATNNLEEQNDTCSQEAQKKISEKLGKTSVSEHHDKHADVRKATEGTDIPRCQPQKDKRLTPTPTEDQSRRKAECSLDGDGDTHSSKKRKSSSNPEGTKQRGKDPVIKTENKPLVATTSSLQSTSHLLEKKEKKDASDSYAKHLKASLELKVVTEVKKWLDPHYRDKSITKEEYKEIVAKCVSKVVSAECGDVIESEKMHILVEGYVKLYRHRRAKQQPTTTLS